MCGILGVVPAISPSAFQKGLDKIAHRGPDGFGIWQSDDERRVQFGHRRLAIIDTSEGGHQPMHYAHLSLTFNGEIYNFLELRDELRLLGHSFHSESDSEVLLAAFVEWGHDCFRRFNGMWSLAIYDRKTHQLTLSRDRWGKKPLYYSFYKNRFFFGSEMKAIYCFFDSVEPSDDYWFCVQNRHTYESTDKCLFKHLKRFPAGHSATVDFEEKTLRLRRFFNIEETLVEVPQKYEEQVEAFQALFADAIRLRMRSDVKIGTSLSGGVDSTAVASTMNWVSKNNGLAHAREAADWQTAVTATMPGSPLDESELAQKTADFLKIRLEKVDINQITDPSKLENYLTFLEELQPTNPIPMMETYKRMRELGIVVTLDGHGGDELLYGYHSFYEAAFDCGLRPRKLLEIQQTRLDTLPKDKEFQDLQFGQFDLLKFILRKWAVKSYIKVSKLPFLKDKMRIPFDPPPINPRMGHFNSMLSFLMTNAAMLEHLRNYDRYSMFSGVEIRMPFLDHRVVGFLLSIPWESKIRGGYIKAILRQSIADKAPAEVVWRKMKTGFGSPMRTLFQNDWREYLLDSVESADFRGAAMINSASTARKVRHVVLDESATFADAAHAFQAFVPFVLEKNIVKNHHPIAI